MKAKLSIAALLLVSLVLAVTFGLRSDVTAQSDKRRWAASPDEVRDAERIRAGQNALNMQSQALLQRASSRLKYAAISYDFETCEWVSVPSASQVGPAGVVAPIETGTVK